jgi:hypothetical protein
MLADPKAIVALLGGSLIIAVIMYVVVSQVMVSQNISGGLWDVGLLLLSVVPVTAAILYIFS